MEIKEPPFRCCTEEAILSLVERFGLPYNESMQDWPIEISDTQDLSTCINRYKLLQDDDQKFCMMELILETFNDNLKEESNTENWKAIQDLLQQDFVIHAYTIYYYCDFENTLEHAFNISPFVRNFWNNYFPKT